MRNNKYKVGTLLRKKYTNDIFQIIFIPWKNPFEGVSLCQITKKESGLSCPYFQYFCLLNEHYEIIRAK